MEKFKYTSEQINYFIKQNKEEAGIISDGYHTFNELYDHRIALYVSLCILLDDVDGNYDNPKRPFMVTYSKYHHDGDCYEGWLLVQVVNNYTKEQISYHIPDSYKEKLDKEFIKELPRALKWDGHTSEDVLERLNKWF